MGERVSNDWQRIEAALHADGSIPEARRREIWRWTTLARPWLDAQGLDIRALTHGDALRFVDQVPPTSGPKNRHQRIWALTRLAEVARSIAPPRSRRPDSLSARVDAIPERSPLGKAVARVLASAKSEGDRRRFAVCLGSFLVWCDARGIPAADCWDGDLATFRRDRLEAGYRSPGEYVRVARRLLGELGLA